ncbi:MAG: glycosyl transferase family 28 [Gammaproteobacteria bacterium]|nr:glycosyl transferase family 28 [Gammaproteobacteria bacterium]
MIFLTVGTQLPFDRLARAVDNWCAERPDHEVIGQIGEPGRNGYRPTHFEWWPFVEPSEFVRRLDQSSVIVAHAGMGSIISAMLHAKPIVIMPRRDEFGEHRNNHQYATAKSFSERPLVHVAMTETDLPSRIEAALRSPAASAGDDFSRFAETSLIDAIRTTIVSAGRQGGSRSARQ